MVTVVLVTIRDGLTVSYVNPCIRNCPRNDGPLLDQ